MNFGELGLSDELLVALGKCGIETPTAIQEGAIPCVLAGNDLIGKSVTGSGKTFAYGLPLIHMLDKSLDCVQGLIICPTRELAEQVATELRKVTNSMEGVKVLLICGGMDMRKQIKSLKEEVKIVVGTPGRLIDHLNRRTLKPAGIKTVVLDEADEMLSMGFHEELTSILEVLSPLRRTLMFSATMPDGVREIATKYMQNPQSIEIGDKIATVAAIKQGYIFCKNADKIITLVDALKAVNTDKCLVFCNTRSTVETLADALQDEHFNVRAIHGQMQQSERRRAMTAARSYSGAVLVATDVAARGIDISDIEYVFNFDIPHDLEYYIHRIGRTARAGKEGTAITMVTTRMQQSKLRSYADEAKSKLVAMAVENGHLIEVGAVKDAIIESVKVAVETGNLSAVEELARVKEVREVKMKNDDKLLENMLGMLRRKPDKADILEQLRTFGYTDEDLLCAALSLYADVKTSLDRSHEARDKKREGKNYNRTGDSNGYSSRPYGGRSEGGARKSYGERKPYGASSEGGERKSYGERKPYGTSSEGGERKSYGEKRTYAPRPETSDGEKRTYAPRPEGSGEKKPYGSWGHSGSGEKKTYGGYGKSSGGYGHKSEDGEKRGYTPNAYGKKSTGNRPFKPRTPQS